MSRPDSDTQIIDFMILRIMDSEAFKMLLDQKVEEKVNARLVIPEYFTREEMANMWKVSKQVIDRMTAERLRKQGYVKEKINTCVRFKRID